MQGLLFEFTSFLFFVFLILNTLSWIWLWQAKDHNFKRLLVYLRDTKEGRGIIFGPLNILKWIVLFSYAFTIFISGIDLYFHLAVFFLYLILVLQFIRKAVSRVFEFPKFRLSTIFILFFVITVEVLLYYISPLDKFLWLLILDKFLTLLIFTFILFISVYYDFVRDTVINRAITKIQQKKNLLTIVVVGSYGKGTTKEFAARMLKSKYNVLETKTSFETPYGISKTIVSGLDNKKQIFIAEIQDYAKKDIEEMCSIISPRIAVITGINDREISLFGSIEKIIQSKLEAVEELPADGVAIVNLNSEYSQNLIKQIKRKTVTYSGQKDTSAAIYIESIDYGKTYTSIVIRALGKKYILDKIKLIGRQNVESLLPGILISLHLGIDFSRVRDVISKVTPLRGTMMPVRQKKGAIIIDDSHNATTNSISVGIEYVKQFRGKKILVLEPIEELGKNARTDHEKIGAQVGKNYDYLFLTNHNFKKDILRGIKKSGNKCQLIVATPAKIADFIERECSKNDVVMLEGREAGRALLALSHENIY